ncbi:MAG: benzoyl-CoA 2,3-epoxidase subunit BoxB [Planctomycetota bacterium]|nr:MAG: benzoyl-CoA 2,3-epoxidase subunit BoxB [Planctomycetota bacterium]
MTSIDYSQKIPNNVDLASDKRLQRALEKWQPDYLRWWHEMGPTDFETNEVYLRTAVSVEPDGWAHFGYVRMPEYRWGIFLEPQQPDRRIPFGDRYGQPVWQEVPGEYRTELRRLIVTQADTEPASVEQQRMLGHTAPSLYDLRNLFQVNVEEGRHLWAMVYLLHRYFGKDGRAEAEELLERRSGNPDRPRILGTFNEPIDTWLDFFCFTMFTDRDGKFQLLALAESGFDPLARTCRFMLTEEAHHLFVGQTGIGRVIQRTCEVMREHPDADPREHGAIPLPLLQKYVNFWVSSSTDLYGSEVSSNAANYFAAGLKGRAWEEKNYEDHVALDGSYTIEKVEDGRIVQEEVPLRNAMNEVLRSDYLFDNQKGVDYWNKIVKKHGIDFEFRLPHRRFHRRIGMYTGACFDLDGNPIDEAAWNARKSEWLPTEEDRAFVASLMQPCLEPGRFAAWIAPPAKGLNGQPLDFEYVRL